jgi:hypothetical protein
MAEKKNVLVVGASRGLGLALAEEYCARDCDVPRFIGVTAPSMKSSVCACCLED